MYNVYVEKINKYMCTYTCDSVSLYINSKHCFTYIYVHIYSNNNTTAILLLYVFMNPTEGCGCTGT